MMTADRGGAPRRSPPRVWDVIVVGAGPAGAAAAIDLARRGLDVLIVDRETLPRGKLCGSCLSAAAVREIGRLRGPRPRQPPGSSPGREFLAALGAVPLDHVRLAAGGTTARIGMAGGMVLSRDRLDAALLDLAIEAGAVFLPRMRCVRVVEHADAAPTDAGSAVGLSAASGAAHELRCRLVVMATGLADHVRIGVDEGGRAAGASPHAVERQRRVRPGSRVGVGTVLPAAVELSNHPAVAGLPPGELVMAVARTGYCGIVRLEDGRLDLAAAVDRRSLTTSPAAGVSRVLGEAWGLADAAMEAVAATLSSSPWRATPPLTHSTPLVAGSTGRILRVGDAAGYVEPFTGEGIGWALASGRLLAAAVATPAGTGAGAADAPMLLPPATAAARYVAAHARHFRPRHARCGRVARGLRMPSIVEVAVRTAGRVPWAARHVAAAVVGGGCHGESGR